MPFEVAFPLAELMRLVSVSDNELASKLRLDRNHLRDLKLGRWADIHQHELRRIGVWSARQGLPLPIVRPSPLWSTFRNAETMIFRATNAKGGQTWDAAAEAEISLMLHDLDANLRQPTALEPRSISECIESANCVFIGSPRTNLATEFALSHLFGIEPQRSTTKLKDSRFKFLWRNPTDLAASSSFGQRSEPADTIGIAAHVKGAPSEQRVLEADYFDKKQFRSWSGTAKDCGVVVARRTQLGKTAVTTIVVAGYAGFATLDLIRALIGDGVAVFPSELRRDQKGLRLETLANLKKPSVVYFQTMYHKRAGGDHRDPVNGSRQWFPPWLPETKKRSRSTKT